MVHLMFLLENEKHNKELIKKNVISYLVCVSTGELGLSLLFIRCWLDLLLFSSLFLIFHNNLHTFQLLFFLPFCLFSRKNSPRCMFKCSVNCIIFFTPDPLPPPIRTPFCVNTLLLHLLQKDNTVILQIILVTDQCKILFEFSIKYPISF